MLTRRLFVLAVLILALFISCTRPPTVTPEPRDDLDPPFTEEELAALATIEELRADLDSIILPNGRTVADFLEEYDGAEGAALATQAREVGPQAQKNLIIGKMQAAASRLTNRSNFVYPQEPPQNGVLRPAQTGLAYSYDSKQYAERRAPKAGSCKGAAVFGLDCSGFMYHLASAAGLSGFPAGPANQQRMPETWNSAFKRAGIEKLKAKDLGALPTSKFETGDIIYWLRGGDAYHIGVVFAKADGGLGVFQSNGSDSSKCEENYGPKRGPRALNLNDPYWFGSKARTWDVLRIVTEISGEYQLHGRCVDRTTDAFTFTIQLSSEDNQQVSASGTGTDYNGAPINIAMSGTYTQETNMLSARLDLTFPNDPDGRRSDAFEQRLNEDDTGYFATIKVVDNGGCQAAVRLVNLETKPQSQQVEPQGGSELEGDGLLSGSR